MATNLASTASIRSVLGVSERELRDDVLLDPTFSVLLNEDLYAISPDLVADYEIADAVDPKTTIQQRFVDLTQTYAAYQIALQCCNSVSMFAPETIKDSRSELTRGADFYKTLRADIQATLKTLRVLLRSAYAAINPIYTPPTAIERIRVVAVPLGIDPVTGA